MFLNVPNIKIKSIAACVPKQVTQNTDEKLIHYTGIRSKRTGGFCASDLCYEAAKSIMDEESDFDVVIFVSQTPDYSVPSTSVILQDRLGIGSHAMAFDINMSCSGWVYGLSVMSSLLSINNRRGLLLVGDTLSRLCSKEDQSTYPLFGDCGTATILEYIPGEEGFKFHLGSDGSGHENIIVPDSGMRNPVSVDSFTQVEYSEGIKRSNVQLSMDGMGVFFFVQKRIPESIKLLMLHFIITNVDYFVFHQSNKFMIETVAKKMKIPLSKVPLSLGDFGNTSSASIPLTLLTNRIQGNIVACGYGAGLSWGSVNLTLDTVYANLIEI